MGGLVRTMVPTFLLSWYHFLWALLGALWYGFPSSGMTVIGVTGTNGKSTTVDMISRVFREGGLKIASLSSVRFEIQGEERRNTMKMTMPGRLVIQRFLREARNAGCTHIVLEVTSEGMLQHRHRFISFHTAVFTNLSPEHLERHGSFKNYKKTKGKLFAAAKKVHVVNADDEHAPFFLQFPAKKNYLYSLQESGKGAIVGEALESDEKGTRFTVQGVRFELPLLGSFNAYNALAAITVGSSQGIPLETMKKALERMERVPGRMEEVISSPFRVVVDYAFTPAALEKVYRALKSKGKLICVLGAAGGGRDAWKRPVLGEIASRHCDNVLVTNEDPYDEDPRKIMEEVAAGTKGKAQIVEDRREAIAEALSQAKAGDIVVITGKGSEDSIAEKGKKIPWDDREVVKQEVEKVKRPS